MKTKHGFWMIVLMYLLIPRHVYAHSPEVMAKSLFITLALGATIVGLAKFLLLRRRLLEVYKYAPVIILVIVLWEAMLIYVFLVIWKAGFISRDPFISTTVIGLLYTAFAMFPNLFLLREKGQKLKGDLFRLSNVMSALGLIIVSAVIFASVLTLFPLISMVLRWYLG